MYLTNSLIINSGPITEFEFKAPFNADGTPKPVVLVGTNGSGKTNALSILADALIEIASLHLSGVMPENGGGRSYFRIVGGRNLRVSATFELALAKFKHGNDEIFYRSKAGTIAPGDVADRTADFTPIANWPVSGNDKSASGPEGAITAAFQQGANVFFPANRFELPHWLNRDVLERDPEASFELQMGKRLTKPLVVQSALQDLKPWIVNVMLDMSLPPTEVLQAYSLDALKGRAISTLGFAQTYSGLSKIIATILRRDDARIARLNRSFAERRICVAYGDEVAIPSLDHLSAGQATLLAMFATILRYGDVGAMAKPLSDIEGIVLIDEIDAHLHADLQHDALPALIKLFPRVQFIVSSNAPLFPLGMQKLFGDDGFTLIDMPSGLTIDAERFSEFEASLSYFRATRTFENDIKLKITAGERPLVLCEGETDPIYLRAAAQALEMLDLLNQVDFDWVGQKTASGASGGGKPALDEACRFLRHNPQFLKRRTVALYDADTRKPPEDLGDLFIRTLPFNAKNQIVEAGIENLLPESVFIPPFIREVAFKTKGMKATRSELDKTALCQHLCQDQVSEANFQLFRPVLEELRAILLPQSSAASTEAADQQRSN